jgi:hypothetical protein
VGGWPASSLARVRAIPRSLENVSTDPIPVSACRSRALRRMCCN